MDDVFMSGSEDIITYKCNLYRDLGNGIFFFRKMTFQQGYLKAHLHSVKSFPNLKRYGPMDILEMMF